MMIRSLLAIALLLLAACSTSKSAQRADCVCEDGCWEACEGGEVHTSYKTVQRAPGERRSVADEAALFEPADPHVDGVELDGSAAASALEQLGLSPDDVDAIFQGDFASGGDDADYAIIHSDGTLQFRTSDGAGRGRTSLGELVSVRTVNLIDDRVELAVEHRDGDAIHFSVFRLIGNAAARVFTIELERDGTAQNEVDFVALGEERAIRVTSIDAPTPQVFRWNHWEGMFRVPAPAPTAPPRQGAHLTSDAER